MSLPEQVGKVHRHMSNTRNSDQALVSITYYKLYIRNNIDMHQLALFLLFVCCIQGR